MKGIFTKMYALKLKVLDILCLLPKPTIFFWQNIQWFILAQVSQIQSVWMNVKNKNVLVGKDILT